MPKTKQIAGDKRRKELETEEIEGRDDDITEPLIDEDDAQDAKAQQSDRDFKFRRIFIPRNMVGARYSPHTFLTQEKKRAWREACAEVRKKAGVGPQEPLPEGYRFPPLAEWIARNDKGGLMVRKDEFNNFIAYKTGGTDGKGTDGKWVSYPGYPETKVLINSPKALANDPKDADGVPFKGYSFWADKRKMMLDRSGKFLILEVGLKETFYASPDQYAERQKPVVLTGEDLCKAFLTFEEAEKNWKRKEEENRKGQQKASQYAPAKRDPHAKREDGEESKGYSRGR